MNNYLELATCGHFTVLSITEPKINLSIQDWKVIFLSLSFIKSLLVNTMVHSSRGGEGRGKGGTPHKKVEDARREFLL